MIIQDISIYSGILRTPAGERRSATDAERQSPLPVGHLPVAQEKAAPSGSARLSGQGKDALEVFYPPFFPLGNTQGIYTVLISSREEKAAEETATLPRAEDDPKKTAQTRRQPSAAETKPQTESGRPDASAVAGSVLDLKI
jgi:hypothetical protein